MEKYFFPNKNNNNNNNNYSTSYVVSNNFKIKFNNAILVYRYKIIIEPDKPVIRNKIIKSIEQNILENFTKFEIVKNSLFSTTFREEDLVLTTIFQGQEYEFKIIFEKQIDKNSADSLSLARKLIHDTCNNMNYINMNSGYFNTKPVKLDEVEIIDGFIPSISINQGKDTDTTTMSSMILNINMKNIFLRTETAYNLLTTLISKYATNTLEIKEFIDSAFRGLSVITKFNNKYYNIDHVDLTLSPMNSFTTNEGYITTYVDYYKNKYDIDINAGQPLLVNKKSDGSIIHLIPELSYLIGLSDEMFNNYSLMNKIEEVIQESPRNYVEDTIYIINKINSNQNAFESWGMQIINEPVVFPSKSYSAGNIEMYMYTNNRDKKRYSIDLENIHDIERKYRVQMYSQPPINEWAVKIIII